MAHWDSVSFMLGCAGASPGSLLLGRLVSFDEGKGVKS